MADDEMLKRPRDTSGQAIGAEVVITFVVVVTAMVLISTYVRRALQGRARDTIIYTRDEAAQALGSDILLQYEPYYINSTADVRQSSTSQIETIGAEFVQTTDQSRTMQSNAIQLAPKEWN